MIQENKIKTWFARHWLALAGALLAGLISIAPQILTIKALGKEYQGIPFFYADDNVYYAAKIREILDGHGWAGSPYFYEYKEAKSLVWPMGEWFYAGPALVFNLSVPTVILLAKFLLPAVLFFLIYLLAGCLTGEKGTFKHKINALAGGFLVALGYDLIDIKTAWGLISGQIHSANTLIWTRPVNPIIGALLFFIFLLLLWSIIKSGRRFLFLPAGLISALMIGYFFSWSLALALVGVLLIIFFIKKEYKTVKALLAAAIISFLASLPYWYNLWQTFSSSRAGSSEQSARLYGLLLTHQPVLNKVLLASLLIFLPCFFYEYWQKKRQEQEMEKWWWFCLALLLAGLAVLNQQIITGRTIWYPHFVQYTIPAAMIALLVLFYNFIRPRLPRIWLAGILVIIIASLSFGLAAARTYAYGLEDMKSLQRYGSVLSWLNRKAESDCVVLVNEPGMDLGTLLPAYTPCNVYASAWNFLSALPRARINHNFLVWIRLQGIAPAEIENFLRNHPTDLRDQYADNWQDILLNRFDQDWLEAKVRETAAAYTEFSKKDFTGELKQYRLDYIVSEGELGSEIKLLLPNLEFIGNFNGLFLYKI